jgi:uncharacterized RmlC-like cupin family protein
MKSVLFLASAVLLTVCAADAPSGFSYWSAADLQGYQQKLKPKINEQKVATQPLGSFGNHTAMVAHREGDGEAELHELMADFFVAQTGEATLVYGGQVEAAKTTAPNEIRGPSIKGGQKRKLVPGDVVHIPAKMPHQLLVENGKQFTYFVVKVRSER